MHVIGELYDKNMALTLRNELHGKGFAVELQSIPNPEGKGPIYCLYKLDPEGVEEARNYFRVRMGLPGPAPEPDPEWEKMASVKLGPASKAILLISVMVFVTSFSRDSFQRVLEGMFFNEPGLAPFESIMKGELWRLITPVFLHFGFVHILFNGMWIKSLGALFEKQKGSTHFILFFVVVSVASNFFQYLFSGPQFGGLSGFVYGLFGQLWVAGTLAPNDEKTFRLPKRDVAMMVGWYFLCLTGFIGPIANLAHGVGLSVGMIWSLFPLNRGDKKKKAVFFLYALFFTFGTYGIELLKNYIM